MISGDPFSERQPLQEYFQTLTHIVVGQALQAAGYERREEPMKWISGCYRYTAVLHEHVTAYIEFQVLIPGNSAWVGKQPARFTVMLARTCPPAVRPPDHLSPVQRRLSQLVVEDFRTPILPDKDYWWAFENEETLGKGLAEAGYLIVGYGIPWLAGDLRPDADR